MNFFSFFRRWRFKLSLDLVVGLSFLTHILIVTGQGSNERIVLGYLPTVRGGLQGRMGIAISGAASLAIAEINNNSNLLPGVDLDLVWDDTLGDRIRGTKILTDMLCNNTAAFFGPETSCDVEATVAAAWNRTMISYKCADASVSNKQQYPTFARTEAPDHQVVKSVLALMKYYSWNIFQIIAEKSITPRYTNLAETLKTEAENHSLKPNDPILVFSNNEEGGMYWFNTIDKTRTKSRIYVFIGEEESLVEMMGTMQSLKMFDNGEYLVIYIDVVTDSHREVFKYLWRLNDITDMSNCRKLTHFEDRTARSLLVVAPSPPNESTYEAFSEKVTEYSERPPFKFSGSSFIGSRFKKYVSVYAANLYDSIYLYAEALDAIWLETNRTEDIQRLARDGPKVFASIIKKKSYNSITGALISIDANGDSEGNYTLMAYKEQNYTRGIFSCDHSMAAVAIFHAPDGTGALPKIRFESKIDWDPLPPQDSPKCGFENKLCPKGSTPPPSMVVAGFLGFLLIVVLVVAASLYRKWKIEQEIEGLLWKIDKDELQFQQLFGEQSTSRMSLVSVGSYGQVYCTTAHYKGAMVRVKELKLIKKHVISRQTMKEMRYMREMGHPNINPFYGAVLQPMEISLVYDYCGKGSLSDVVENEDIRLDNSFIASLVHDLIKGMIFLHESDLEYHGNLKSSNCVITSRWVLQLTDFGLGELQQAAALGSYDPTAPHIYYQNLLWKAPELLKEKGALPGCSQKGDVYAFGIILFEIYGRRGPYGPLEADPREIIDQVRGGNSPSTRPDLSFLDECPSQCPEFVRVVMREAWDDFPENRPTFRMIREKLKPLKEGMSSNIVDQMIVMMDKYSQNLEGLVNQRTLALEHEKKKTEDLLHRMLPMPVAQRLTVGDPIEPESFEMVTIYFSDIVGFTQMSAESTPFQVVNFLNDLYTLFDSIIRGYDVYKVETIGDAYMVVSGCPLRNADHAGHIASMALDLREAIFSYRIAHRPTERLKLRIGIHSGPVCAGVVGLTMPRYCLFGDTVNTSSRMESNGEALKIHISNECKEALDALGGYITEERGYVHLKGKGNVLTHWLTASTEGAVQRKEMDSLPDLRPLFSRPQTTIVQNFGGNFSDQPSFRRRASPKVAAPGGSVNVSRQGSFCAGSHGSGNPLLTAARNSTHYIRRPSFDPALLNLSLRNSVSIGQSGCGGAGGGSNSTVNRNSPSPNRRPTSRPTARLPSVVTHRKRSGSVSATSTCSDCGVGLVASRIRPVTEFCAVTIEPPSDSSTPVSPENSPIKILPPPHVTSSHSSISTNSPGRRRIGFGRPKKHSLGNGAREFRSLDQIPDEKTSEIEGPSPLQPIVKTRKLSKSLDITDDLSHILLVTSEQSKNNGITGNDRRQSTAVASNNLNPIEVNDDISSLDERVEDSHLLLPDKSDENTPRFQPPELGDDSDFEDEDDSGLVLEKRSGGSGDDRPTTNKSSRHNSKPSNRKHSENWRRKRGFSGGGAGGVKKWFQNILNGNGVTTSSVVTPQNPTPQHHHFEDVNARGIEAEAGAKLLENTRSHPFEVEGIPEHESVV